MSRLIQSIHRRRPGRRVVGMRDLFSLAGIAAVVVGAAFAGVLFAIALAQLAGGVTVEVSR